jgi:hypothetical protein
MTEQQIAVTRRIEENHRVAYPQPIAASLLGISLSSLKREIRRRKIFPLDTFRTISREELLRYTREETQLSTRRRFRRAKTAATEVVE